MAWLVAPIGVVPNVGDSDRLSKDTLSDLNVQHPALEFALSQGRRGAPPSETFHAFRGAGYVAARDQWAKREEFRRSSYLLQSCGFHSRVHKHADDLSFVWFAEGTNLLADAGKYGYGERHDPDSGSALEGFYYSDPVRMYVESTRAHNCLEIDGRSYPRRRVRPYGSALIHAERDEGSGIVATESQARHWNVRHTRYLFHLPGTWTLVVDYAVDYSTDGETVHDYAQRFQFGPDLELGESSAEQAQFTIPGTERCLAAVELTGARLTPPVRGQEHPLLGFVSPSAGRLLPNWTTAWERDQARDATFATLLALVPQNLSLSATGSINATARKGRVSWEIGPVRHELRWERSDAGLSFGYESA